MKGLSHGGEELEGTNRAQWTDRRITEENNDPWVYLQQATGQVQCGGLKPRTLNLNKTLSAITNPFSNGDLVPSASKT